MALTDLKAAHLSDPSDEFMRTEYNKLKASLEIQRAKDKQNFYGILKNSGCDMNINLPNKKNDIISKSKIDQKVNTRKQAIPLANSSLVVNGIAGGGDGEEDAR